MRLSLISDLLMRSRKVLEVPVSVKQIITIVCIIMIIIIIQSIIIML